MRQVTSLLDLYRDTRHETEMGGRLTYGNYTAEVGDPKDQHPYIA